MKKHILILTLISVSTLYSCTYTRIGDLTIVATRNVESGLNYVELQHGVKGKAKANGNGYALEKAIEDAVEDVKGGEFMKNCKVYVKGNKVKVEGDVWGIKKQ